MKNLTTNKQLWFITTLLTLMAAIIGVIYPGIYTKVLPSELIPGTFAQDLLTIFVCVAVFGLIFTMKQNEYKKQLIIMGIISSFCYLYAIFAIERMYNVLYYLYLAIFSLSFWSSLYSLMNLKIEVMNTLSLSKPVRWLSACFSILIAMLFTILWTLALFPLLVSSKRIDSLYSIYILDLCFVMPAFLITAIMSFKKQPLGLLLTPVMFILGIFVIFPLGLGEIVKPVYGMRVNIGSMLMSFILSSLFLILSVIHLTNLKIKHDGLA